MNIEVFNETDVVLDKPLDELKKYLNSISKDLDLTNGEFNVIIVDNKKIREINKKYRNKDIETDVISFALEDDKTFRLENYRVLGDIYVSIDKVYEQSKNYNHSFKRELFFLSTHGLLHLLGYDHMTKEDEEIMFKKQKELLEKYKVKREK